MGNNRRKNAPAQITDSIANPTVPTDYEATTPKFCLADIVNGSCVENLDKSKRADFARTLQKLASLTWRQILQAPRHGCGTEWMPRARIKASIPTRYQDEPKFMVFRYSGKLPMVGIRDRDIFRILWIECNFGDVYSHGG